MRYVEELVALAPDVRLSMTPLVWGRRAAVARVTQRGHLAAGGGEMELGYAVLFLVADGRLTYFEYFEPADYQQAVVRFEEIGAQTRSPNAYMPACAERSTRTTWKPSPISGRGLQRRRPPGSRLGADGREAIVDVYRSWIEVVPDMEVAFEWLGGDDDHIAMRWNGHGHAAADMGGGAADIS